MKEFRILANRFLCKATRAFYHVPYVRMGNPGNPDYLNVLKNTFNNTPKSQLEAAAKELQSVLLSELPLILQASGVETMAVCVVPRAKAENSYHANQLLFRSSVKNSISKIARLEDGTDYIRRHTNTKTTHLRNPVPGYDNDGSVPFSGITEQTCYISASVRDKNILLIDDIYTPLVNIDEDAIQALLNAGAYTVVFFAVGKT